MVHELRRLLKIALSNSISPASGADLAGCSPTTLRRYRDGAKKSNLTWEDLKGKSESDIDRIFNKGKGRSITKRMPDFASLIHERTKPNVTKGLLWEEYRAADSETAFAYSQFTHHWRQYERDNQLSMRMWHPPGRATYVDYSGKRLRYYCRETQAYVDVEIFVGVLGHSLKTFVCATASQKTEDFLLAHAQMFAYFGGVSEFVVSDNLKAAVINSTTRRLNSQYAAFADQYDFIVDPARPVRPQDKSVVENTVKIIQRWILAKLRNIQFFSLAEINRRMRECLDILNDKIRCKTGESRNQCFERTEKGLLSALPDAPYVHGVWTGKMRVGKDYHLLVDGHWYSVPYQLVGMMVSARYTADIVELFLERNRVATHRRCQKGDGPRTDPAHCPPNHQIYHLSTETSHRAWAALVGPNAQKIIDAQFARSRPQLGLPACVKLKELCSLYGNEAFEAASLRAVELAALSLTTVKSLLQSGRHRDPLEPPVSDESMPSHSNIRGAHYYKEHTV